MSVIPMIACACLAAWIYLLAARGGFWRAVCREDVPVPAPPTWPEIAVIIPARNEADILENTLPTLLANDYPLPLRIVLVDDRSEDATASVAAGIAARFGASERLTVVSARPLPLDWKGKVWAMQCGIEHIAAVSSILPPPLAGEGRVGVTISEVPAEENHPPLSPRTRGENSALNLPRYVLFTDADIAYGKGALMRLAAQAEAEHTVLASLMVRLRCQSGAERFLVPAFVYFFQLLYPFRWVKQGKCAAAAGGCMLVRWEALQRAGGLAPIRNALIDDCALARLMQPQGRMALTLTRCVHSIRAYPRVSDIRAMVARSAYDQLGYSPLNLVASLSGLALIYIAPVLLMLFATGMAQCCGALAWAGMTISFLPILRFYRRSACLSLALPLIALCYMAFTLDSAYQYASGRGGLWKGRVQAANAQAA